MSAIILRPNATPVYEFLSILLASQEEGEATLEGKKVLDCGAGGPLPPLVVFAQQGCECWGIDISQAQLEKAEQFCQAQGFHLYLQQGDMRQMPFTDAFFDMVYEQFAMCHLSKVDTARAVQEMYRVLKPGGRCMLGLISLDTWLPMLGREQAPGEFRMEEHGEMVLHSAFSDAESEQLLPGWQILQKRKVTTWFRESTAEMSLDDWMEQYVEGGEQTRDAWAACYEQRGTDVQYTHMYFLLKKPA